MEGDITATCPFWVKIYFNPLPPCGGRRAVNEVSAISCKFQSTPSVWRETFAAYDIDTDLKFQSTPSVWRETQSRKICQMTSCISIHSLRVEGDMVQRSDKLEIQIFQSTPSVWRETYKVCCFTGTMDISIHSLRVEGDKWTGWSWAATSYFNPLPPCGGRRVNFTRSDISDIFQSTPSVWRETPILRQIVCLAAFQSTPSVWRETCADAEQDDGDPISIHSLRVEGDTDSRCSPHPFRDFNPLPPCGGRPFISAKRTSPPAFQSTPSVWRETVRLFSIHEHKSISIHSLRVEGDLAMRKGRLDGVAISIHSLRVEGDGHSITRQ